MQPRNIITDSVTCHEIFELDSNDLFLISLFFFIEMLRYGLDPDELVSAFTVFILQIHTLADKLALILGLHCLKKLC